MSDEPKLICSACGKELNKSQYLNCPHEWINGDIKKEQIKIGFGMIGLGLIILIFGFWFNIKPSMNIILTTVLFAGAGIILICLSLQEPKDQRPSWEQEPAKKTKSKRSVN